MAAAKNQLGWNKVNIAQQKKNPGNQTQTVKPANAQWIVTMWIQTEIITYAFFYLMQVPS